MAPRSPQVAACSSSGPRAHNLPVFCSLVRIMSQESNDMCVNKQGQQADNNIIQQQNDDRSRTDSKLSKIGRRLRDSCRNLRGKSKNAPRQNPEDFTSVRAANDSTRSKHYVAMDFTGKVGKIVDQKDQKDVVRGYTSGGYAYFRRKCVSPKDVQPFLTELQATAHTMQPWFHKGIGRELAQRILATHNVDGAFLVRESSVSGGFVISYVSTGRTFHAQVLPEGDAVTGVTFSLDDGKTRFFDLLQMVEFYQLNQGSLNSRLAYYIVKEEVSSIGSASGSSGSGSEQTVKLQQPKKYDSQASKSDGSSSCQASESSMTSQQSSSANFQTDMMVDKTDNMVDKTDNKSDKEKPKEDDAKMDTNHNSSDAAMASDSDSLREFHQG